MGICQSMQEPPLSHRVAARIVTGGYGYFNCAHRGLSNFHYLVPRERPRLPSTARIERAHSDRARSASKEGTWPLPSSSFRGRALREQENAPVPWPQFIPSNTASPVPRSTQYSCPTPPPPLWPSPHISPPGERQNGAPAQPAKWQTGAAF